MCDEWSWWQWSVGAVDACLELIYYYGGGDEVLCTWPHTRSGDQTPVHHPNKKIANAELPQQTHHLKPHPLLYVNLCVPSCRTSNGQVKKKRRRTCNWWEERRHTRDDDKGEDRCATDKRIGELQRPNSRGHRREPVYPTGCTPTTQLTHGGNPTGRNPNDPIDVGAGVSLLTCRISLLFEEFGFRHDQGLYLLGICLSIVGSLMNPI